MAKAMKSRTASSKTTKEKPKLSDLKQVLLGADEDHKSNAEGNDAARSDYSSNSNSMLNAPNSEVQYQDFDYSKNPQRYRAPGAPPLDKSALGSAKGAKSWSKNPVDSQYTKPFAEETSGNFKNLTAPDVVNQSKTVDPISSIGNMKVPGPKDSDFFNVRDNSNSPAQKTWEVYSSDDTDPRKHSTWTKENVTDTLSKSNSSVTQQAYKDQSGKVGAGDFSDIKSGNSEFKNNKDSAVSKSSPQVASSTLNMQVPATTNAAPDISMPERPKESPGGDPLKGTTETTASKDKYSEKVASVTRDKVMTPVNESIFSKMSDVGSLSINVFK